MVKIAGQSPRIAKFFRVGELENNISTIICCEISGNGTPLILIPGLGDTVWVWRKIIPFIENKYKVFALEQRGHGRSSSPIGPYKGEDFKNDLYKLIQHNGIESPILIGHGFGALSSLVYIEKEKVNSIDGVVLISLQNYTYIKPPINVLRLIEKIKIPILDIYGSLDFKESIDIAPDRRLASKKSGNSQYYQVEINGADHYFNNMEDNLIDHIINWTDNLL